MVQQWLSPDAKDKNAETVHFPRLDASPYLVLQLEDSWRAAASLQCMPELLKRRFQY